ncbi:uncharacterized protein LOC128223694 [Mya arenaria]|uniref:uncharacterized protein LOC128223694 n=1 Tax=Mya arenaria TaxID=6604 RepID=UPI0022E6CF3E|nr:uncharacterized protein LOC128223694 [Mya arenaria]
MSVSRLYQSVEKCRINKLCSTTLNTCLIILVFLGLCLNISTSEEQNKCTIKIQPSLCSLKWDTKDKESTDVYVNGFAVASCTQKFSDIGGSFLYEKKYQTLYNCTSSSDGQCLLKIKKMVNEPLRINITSQSSGLKSIAVSDNALTGCINSKNTYIILEVGGNPFTNAGAVFAQTRKGLIVVAAHMIMGYY